ncbi:unnamed protein product, partial [Iphiclides podalirius]
MRIRYTYVTCYVVPPFRLGTEPERGGIWYSDCTGRQRRRHVYKQRDQRSPSRLPQRSAACACDCLLRGSWSLAKRPAPKRALCHQRPNEKVRWCG